MKPMHHLSKPLAGMAACCDVLAHGTIRATEEMLPLLRQKPGPPVGDPLPASFLKNADEQTVAGLNAVFKAIHEHGLAGASFSDWGVLAAPRFLGRVTLAAAMRRFAEEGAWGISPHLIPHRSLHSISGTVSQALKIHGPNFGVGGGPGCTAEALLAATALVVGDKLPGVWVVLTGWDPEPDPNLDKQHVTPSVCNALALALTPTRSGWTGSRLRLVSEPRAEQRPPLIPSNDGLTLLGLETLLVALAGQDGLATTVVWQLDGGKRLELERPRCRTRRQGDRETRRQGDTETEEIEDRGTKMEDRGSQSLSSILHPPSSILVSPCLPVSLSPCPSPGAGTENKR